MHRVDFNETFSPTVRRESLCIFLSIAYLFGLIIKQIDIVGAYLESLQSDNNLPIFMKLPPGMKTFRSIRAGLVCRFLRSIYGLRQSGKLWNQKVVSFLKDLGFKPLNANASILIHNGHETGDITIISDTWMIACSLSSSAHHWIGSKRNSKMSTTLKT